MLISHPAVADADVLGRPDSELGEVQVAYVALRWAAGRGELMAWLEGRLAPWKQVRDVVVIDRVISSRRRNLPDGFGGTRRP
jgi:acyl-coenzyme A synthetase/AMP-(fatty) acid ligase